MDTIIELIRHVVSLTTQLDVIHKYIDDIVSPTPSRYTNDSASRPCLKLDVPCFDVSDTHWWIFKISQFFTYHQTSEEDRVTIASVYLDGVALAWHELDERRENGMCFNYKQWWSKQHKCIALIFFIVVTEEEFSYSIVDLETVAAELVDNVETLEDSATPTAQLSLHALYGEKEADTFHLLGHIATATGWILVDGGSTHNFVNDTIASLLGLLVDPIDPFRVLVGGGHEFSAYLILGAQWLKQLGLVLMNYNLLTITFFYNNTCVELHDDSLTPSVGLPQLQRLTRVYSEAQLLSLHIISPPEFITSYVPHPSFSLPDNLELVFSTLLTQYSHLFVEPTTVMPPCSTDHKIFVLPHASPVTVRPYHYPHSQKLEIESQVAKLLKSRWIQPNTSPFSSYILILNKKDRTRCMFIDFQALNAFTVSDRFHLPTIDELLDELGRVKFLFIDDLRNELSLNGHYQARCQQIVADPSITPEFSLSYVGTYELPASDDLLTSREVVFVLLKENLAKAQTKMKEIAEKKRREVQLEVDSLVYFKLQPYHQVSLSGIKYKKLHIRHYGHFRVLSCIGPVAYKLELPSYSKINDVFHCSLLKAHVGPPPIQDDTLPPDSLGNHPLLFPLAIINSRTVIVARNFQKQVSVQ
ncbi:hypothetical protein KIW84_058266 [Lathyrus oleraceus]|uniref:Tf2-1-like SH3-like domain-containing protein n=1 Tax=Pisum sativum TaxID=3888 RepID=A0A9D4X8C3_PEA|nr:hypothetical protein KIW84_058266 [Pisum sativum]